LESYQDATLQLTQGKVYGGEYLMAPGFTGIITNVATHKETAKIIIQSGEGRLTSDTKFKVYSTIWIQNIYLLVESLVLFLIFFCCLSNYKIWKKIIVGSAIISLLLWLGNNVFLQNLFFYDTLFNAFTTLLVITYAIFYFYFQLNKPTSYFIYSSPIFWIVSAILIYKAGTLFLFLYVNTLVQHERANYFIINSIFNIVKNGLFLIGFITYLSPDERKVKFST